MHLHLAGEAPRSRATIAVVTGVIALAGYLLLARVARTPTDGFDLHVERWVAAHSTPGARIFFDAVSGLAGITGMRILGFAGAVVLFFRSRRLGIGMALVVLAGMAVFELAKQLIARPRPAHGYAVDPSFAFPSGHTTLSTAVCGTLAYVLWRERLAPRAAALAVAIAVCLLVGFARVYLDVHWATDVVGGWLAGLTIACVAAAAYELTSSRLS